jgi:hypothetical protein
MESTSESSNREIPMTAPPEQPSQPQAQAPQPQQQAAQEIEFTWNGKQIKAPISDPRVKQWAAQGYDYSQRMAEFNKTQQEIAQRQQQIAEIENRYKPIDEFVKQNPDWWTHVQSQWENRQRALDPTNPLAQELSQVKNQLQEINQFKEQLLTEKQLQQREQLDRALADEVQSIRKTYSNLDWDSPDANGYSLEQQVIKYAVDNGIRKFTTAFRDYYHDNLLKLAEERGKESIGKNIQKQTKLGLLGQTPTPKKQLSNAQDVKSKTYDQLLSEALDELSLGA